MVWLTAAEALQLLGVRPQTLYAQVSRKLIRSRPDPANARRSQYHEQDVRRQARRRAGRRPAEAVAAAAIEWGAPVLESALSTVVQGRLYYRGRDALRLAESASLEQVASLLWQDEAGPEQALPTRTPPLAAGQAVSRALQALATRAAVDPGTTGQTAAALRAQAWSVVQTLAQALCGEHESSPADKPGLPPGLLHERVARSFGTPHAADWVRRSLVLLADHELNASTFAARVCASTGASLGACVSCGLPTLGGPLHGGAHRGIPALVERLSRLDATASQDELRPAFGHPLYPDGDIRARALLALFDLPPAYARAQAWALRHASEHPTVDFALAAMAQSQGWPADAPLVLFALGRSVGWLAHALEQAATGSLIRPRARYVGPEPEAEPSAAARPAAASRWHP